MKILSLLGLINFSKIYTMDPNPNSTTTTATNSTTNSTTNTPTTATNPTTNPTEKTVENNKQLEYNFLEIVKYAYYILCKE